MLGQRRRLWHHTFLAALAMLDQNIVRFDVFRLHQDHLIAAHPGVEQQHNDGLVPHRQEICPIIEPDHPPHLIHGKGINDGFGLTKRLHLLGRVVPFVQIAFGHQIIEPGPPDFEQIIDVPWRAAHVLLFLHQIPDVMWLDILQFSDVLRFQKVHQKSCRCPVVAQGAFCQVPAFAVVQKFIAEILQTHKKTPFLSWKNHKRKGAKISKMVVVPDQACS